MPKKKKKSLALRLRNYFFTGVVVLIPIGFTLYLSKFLMNASSNLLPSKVNPNSYLPINIPGIEIIITIFFITFIGFLSLSFLGKKFLQLIDTLFKKIPLLGTFWSAVKQMSQSFKDNKHKKRIKKTCYFCCKADQKRFNGGISWPCL